MPAPFPPDLLSYPQWRVSAGCWVRNRREAVALRHSFILSLMNTEKTWDKLG